MGDLEALIYNSTIFFYVTIIASRSRRSHQYQKAGGFLSGALG